jgi:protein dithiol oxidoreductase (disulfide-forming)
MNYSTVCKGLIVSALLWALYGCGQNNTAQTTTTSAPAATATTPTPSPNVPPAAATPAADAGDNIATTDSTDETTETGVAANSGPALALRINDAKPLPASQWKEGVNYTRLMPTQPTSAAPGQVEVMEFFWYACPHCNALDPYLQSWIKQGKPNYVSFVRVPVMWSQMHGLHARIFYTAQALGKLDALHSLIFDEFHKNQNPLNSTDKISDFFVKHGVALADFQNAFTSQAVDASLKNAQELELRFKVESVPLVVVNGKYVTDVGKAGGHEQLISLINWLAQLEHGI